METQRSEEVKEFAPDYSHKCIVCGQKPTVLAIDFNDKIVAKTQMCGPCTWGESKMINPKEWNKL